MSKKGWIGFDLDGTLAVYEGWNGVEHIGEPVSAMLEILKGYLEQGQECRIFTARVWSPSDKDIQTAAAAHLRLESQAAHDAILQWCLKHVGRALTITCQKDFGMILLYDDRCIQVEKNTGRLIQ